MLALATNNEADISVSKIEIEVPNRPYTVETLERLNELLPDAEVYFVMGADSWMTSEHGANGRRCSAYEPYRRYAARRLISFDHVTEEIRDRIVDMRVLVEPGRRPGT